MGVVEQRVVAVPPRELLREETSVRKTSQNRLRLSLNPCRTRRDHRQKQGLNKCEATNTLVLLVAIREGVDVAVVEEGVVTISPGELLYKGPGFNYKRYVDRDYISSRRPHISSRQTGFSVKMNYFVEYAGS